MTLLRLALAVGLLMGQQPPEKPWVFAGDAPAGAAPIKLEVSGTVRATNGEPLHSAVVEVVVNPYHPGETSERALAVTDESGRYVAIAQGHQGTVRVRVARDGYQPTAREMSFIKRDRELTFNFSLPPVRQPR